MASTTLHHKRKITRFEMLHGAWWENLKEMDHLEDLCVDVTTLQLILNK